MHDAQTNREVTVVLTARREIAATMESYAVAGYIHREDGNAKLKVMDPEKLNHLDASEYYARRSERSLLSSHIGTELDNDTLWREWVEQPR